MSELSAAIEAQGPRLTARVLGEMYQDPFWTSRYGARGRQHAEADSRYHVTYLAEALRNDDARILTRYARWLRSVLVSRGMCSAHLAENFSRLEAALADELTGSEPAISLLIEARAALRYEEGLARWIDDHRPDLVRLVAGPAESNALDDLALRLGLRVAMSLSYLADALHLERLELFLDYLRWYRDFLFARGESPERLVGAFAELARHLAGTSELTETQRPRLVEAFQLGALTLEQRPSRASAQ